MNDQELRQIVRQAIAKQMGSAQHVRVQDASMMKEAAAVTGSSAVSEIQFVPSTVAFGDHASHSLYMQLVNTDGACVIEPRVQCDHCGYCKSHGH